MKSNSVSTAEFENLRKPEKMFINNKQQRTKGEKNLGNTYFLVEIVPYCQV